MKAPLIITPELRVPFSVIEAVFMDRNVNSFETAIMRHLAGGKAALAKRRIPLGAIAKHADACALTELPWGTANMTNTEYWAYLLRSELEDLFKRPVDTASLAKFFHLPKGCLAVSPQADTVNGMMLMADGWGYTCKWAYYHPKSRKRYTPAAWEAVLTPVNEDEFISAKTVIEAISRIDVKSLNESVQIAGLNLNVYKVPGFNKAEDFFRNVFEWNLQKGFKRTAVADFDYAIANRRFWFAFGTGSNIRVFAPLNHIPEAEVEQATG